MKNLETKISINAPLNRVWEILMNHNDYYKWNPFIRKIKGDNSVGNTLVVEIKSSENKSMEFQPKVLINEFEKEFRWLGHLYVKGLFDGEHYFQLESIGPNETIFTHGENFTGILSGVLLKMIGENTKKGFQSMNIALKEGAETFNQ